MTDVLSSLACASEHLRTTALLVYSRKNILSVSYVLAIQARLSEIQSQIDYIQSVLPFPSQECMSQLALLPASLRPILGSHMSSTQSTDGFSSEDKQRDLDVDSLFSYSSYFSQENEQDSSWNLPSNKKQNEFSSRVITRPETVTCNPSISYISNEYEFDQKIRGILTDPHVIKFNQEMKSLQKCKRCKISHWEEEIALWCRHSKGILTHIGIAFQRDNLEIVVLEVSNNKIQANTFRSILICDMLRKIVYKSVSGFHLLLFATHVYSIQVVHDVGLVKPRSQTIEQLSNRFVQNKSLPTFVQQLSPLVKEVASYLMDVLQIYQSKSYTGERKFRHLKWKEIVVSKRKKKQRRRMLAC